MAITLNKLAVRCENDAIGCGRITGESSPRMSLYDISVRWRTLMDATAFRHPDFPKYSEKEVEGARVLLSTLAYLRRVGCANIEQLLRDVADKGA